MNTYTITDSQLGAFEKHINAAALATSSSLSKLLSTTVSLETVEPVVIKPEVLCEQVGRSEEIFTTIAMRFSGGLKGIALLMMPYDNATQIAETITHQKEPGDKTLSPLAVSALKEVANIITGSFLKGVGNTNDSYSIQSVPDIATDMLKATLDELCSEIALESSITTAVSIGLSIEPVHLRGTLALMFDAASTAAFFKSLS